MFEFLFNYRPELFREGQIALLAGPVRIALVALGLVLTAWMFWRLRANLSGSDKVSGTGSVVLLALRSLGVLALGLALLEPALVLSALKPQESFVAVLADTSSSMTVADTSGIDSDVDTRADWLERALFTSADDSSGGEFWRRLSERFQVRTYSFGAETQRLDVNSSPDFTARRSDLGSALAMVRAELTGVPLAGVVVLTDGAIDVSDELSDETLQLRSAGIPVFPVAVGSERFERDLEVQSVRAPRRVLLGSTVEATVQLSYPGFAGEDVTLEVRDDGRVVDRREVELPLTGDSATNLELSFRVSIEGTRTLEFMVAPNNDAPEAIQANNRRTVLVEVEPGPHKILYFEGEPRFEYKFIRRAIADDPQLQLVSLLRMADKRFYRQSVDDEEELRDGFPTRREDLFKYKGLVLGSVEASFFTYEQMRMIVDFAAERGGGVLFLGGSQALAEGGLAGTPLSELVPTELEDRREVGPRGVSVSVRPTALGLDHAVLQLGGEKSGQDSIWDSLPELLLLNRTGRIKPGATALLTGRSDELGEDLLVLAHQRFGRGSSMLFLPTDSFRWQMRMPTEDQTHEVLWRQILRWLINGVDQRTLGFSARDFAEVGDVLPLEASVRDHRFQLDSNAVVDAEVTSPSGSVVRLPLAWNPLQDGHYQGDYAVAESGRHSVRVVAESQDVARAFGEPTAITEFEFEAGPQNSEFFGAVQRSEVLDRLATETGGKRFEGRELSALIDELSYSQSGVTVREERPLWNMPILFIVVLLSLLGEWSSRRWLGLR